MITTTGEEITSETARYKFGGDPMAEYLHLLSMEQGNADEQSGDVEAPTGWFARFGKRILTTDSQGFVSCRRCPNELLAQLTYRALELEYEAWNDQDEDTVS